MIGQARPAGPRRDARACWHPPAVSPALPHEQASDIRGRVLRHLQVMVGDAPVNPREVKRYVNEYTRLMAANPALNPDVVLCLSTRQRRTDWRVIHEALLEWGMPSSTLCGRASTGMSGR